MQQLNQPQQQNVSFPPLPLNDPNDNTTPSYDPYATPITIGQRDPFATPIIKEKLTNQASSPSSSSSSSNTMLYIGIFAVVGIVAFGLIVYFWNKYKGSSVSPLPLSETALQPMQSTFFGTPDAVNLSDLGNLKDLDLI